MKQNNSRLLMIASILLILCSCSKMNSLHQGYLDEGEVIYAARIDSFDVRPGNNRQQIDLHYSAQRIERGVISWSDGKDSILFDIPPVSGDYYSVLIPEIKEGDYTYKLVTYDKYENSSLPTEITGHVYGDSYKNSLINKRILKVSIEQEEGKDITVIEWGVSENSVHIELKYKNIQGKNITLTIPTEDKFTRISDNVKGAEFVYSTFYRPTELAIDFFQSEYKTMNFPN